MHDPLTAKRSFSKLSIPVVDLSINRKKHSPSRKTANGKRKLVKSPAYNTYHLQFLRMHPLVDQIEPLFLPEVQGVASELVADLFSDYRIRLRKSLDDAERRWSLHLQPFLTRVRAGDLTTDRIRAYITKRQDEDAEKATINRELALLKRAFNHGLECTPPKVKTILSDADGKRPRRGFLESARHAALAKECAQVGLWLRAMFEIGSSYGWRLGEVLGLKGAPG